MKNPYSEYSVQVLGKFVPEKFSPLEIEFGLNNLMPEALKGYFYFSVRRPSFIPIDRNITDTWHNDCGQRSRLIVLWASYKPTEIMFPLGNIYQADPFEVVLIDNLMVHHRTPAKAYQGTEKRWFAVGRPVRREDFPLSSPSPRLINRAYNTKESGEFALHMKTLHKNGTKPWTKFSYLNRI